MAESVLRDKGYLFAIQVVKLFLTNKRTSNVVVGSLINLLKQLPASAFLQVHKLFMVNKNVTSEKGKEVIMMKFDSTIPVGRRYEVLVCRIERSN